MITKLTNPTQEELNTAINNGYEILYQQRYRGTVIVTLIKKDGE